MTRVKQSQNFKGLQGRMEDTGFGGEVDYRADAFKGNDVAVEIYHESKPGEPQIEKLEQELLDLIARDMAPVFAGK